MNYKSLFYIDESCNSCGFCINTCPTSAIRSSLDKIDILSDMCINCGICTNICPTKSIVSKFDDLAILDKYDINIAIPDPTLFSQFKKIDDVSIIIKAIEMLGFNKVYTLSDSILNNVFKFREILSQKNNLPLISPTCPSVVKLIKTKFPSLGSNIPEVESIIEREAKNAIKDFQNETKSIGVFYISPCSARLIDIKERISNGNSCISGVFSIKYIHSKLENIIYELKEKSNVENHFGLDIAISGGESKILGNDKAISVDGIYNLSNILEGIQKGKFDEFEFFEGYSCTEGCIGGDFTIENVYIARSRLNNIISSGKISNRTELSECTFSKQKGFDVFKPDFDVFKFAICCDNVDIINEKLPGLDCGECGFPTCKAFAQKVVRSGGSHKDCAIYQKIDIENQ